MMGHSGDVNMPGAAAVLPFGLRDRQRVDRDTVTRMITDLRAADFSVTVEGEPRADSPSLWERTEVEVDVMDGATGPVLARGAAMLEGPDGAPRRRVTAVVALPHLPPGRYVASARVMHDATEVAQVRRPFRVTASPAR